MWIELQLASEVVVPISKGRHGDVTFGWIGRHLRLGDGETGHIVEEILDSTLSKLEECAGITRLRDGVGRLGRDLGQWFDRNSYLGVVRRQLASSEKTDGIHTTDRFGSLKLRDLVNVGRLDVREEPQQLPCRRDVRIRPTEVNW